MSLITTNKHLEVKSTSGADLFVCCLLEVCLLLFRYVVCPPQINKLTQSPGPPAFQFLFLLDYPHPQNFALDRRRIGARKLCENLMHISIAGGALR
jgi:hypothetical protein